MDGKVFLLSHITDALITLDLKTGAIERDEALFNFWIHSKTCAVPTASATGLYFRRDSCYMFDLPSRQTVDLTAVTRPGCWMSIIPAGGLVLMPEASSGCTCGFALQTSVVLAPAARGAVGPAKHACLDHSSVSTPRIHWVALARPVLVKHSANCFGRPHMSRCWHSLFLGVMVADGADRPIALPSWKANNGGTIASHHGCTPTDYLFCICSIATARSLH